MLTLKYVTCMAIGTACASVSSSSYITRVPPSIPHIIGFVAQSEHVDPKLMQAICWVESGNNPSRINRYDGGSPSLGLCQIKRSTARLHGFKGTNKDLLNPYTNVRYASRVIASALKRYKNVNKALRVYNLGHWDGQYNTKYSTVVLAEANK